MAKDTKSEEVKIIEAQFSGFKLYLNEKFEQNDKDHSTIIGQTTKTNGRVTSLEVFKNRMIGALIVLNLVFGAFITYVLTVLRNVK